MIFSEIDGLTPQTKDSNFSEVAIATVVHLIKMTTPL